MAREMMIAGNSGTGKSTSLRNLDPAETFIVNCGKKPLPFRGADKHYKEFTKDFPEGNIYNTNEFEKVIPIIKYVGEKRPEVKYLIVDDWQYSFAAYVIKRIGDKGFDKFNSLAKGIWDMVEIAKNQRDDLNIVFISHLDSNYNTDGVKETKAKTLGKMIDNTVNLDGLFTTILYSEAVKTDEGMSYVFRTKTNGSDTCKTPMDMFSEEYIPNDLGVAIAAMREYYEG